MRENGEREVGFEGFEEEGELQEMGGKTKNVGSVQRNWMSPESVAYVHFRKFTVGYT